MHQKIERRARWVLPDNVGVERYNIRLVGRVSIDPAAEGCDDDMAAIQAAAETAEPQTPVAPQQDTPKPVAAGSHAALAAKAATLEGGVGKALIAEQTARAIEVSAFNAGFCAARDLRGQGRLTPQCGSLIDRAFMQEFRAISPFVGLRLEPWRDAVN